MSTQYLGELSASGLEIQVGHLFCGQAWPVLQDSEEPESTEGKAGVQVGEAWLCFSDMACSNCL